MAMQEKHRTEIYQAFTNLVSEEAAQAMMAQFPARDVEEPVTKADLALGLGELRAEIGGVRAEIGEVRAELRAELHTEIAGVRREIADLRAEMHREMGALGDRLTSRMLTLGGLGLAAMTGLLALFT